MKKWIIVTTVALILACHALSALAVTAWWENPSMLVEADEAIIPESIGSQTPEIYKRSNTPETADTLQIEGKPLDRVIFANDENWFVLRTEDGPGYTYTISGTTFGFGALWPGVTVSVGSASATSDSNGNYTISGLSNGVYTVSASIPGYSMSASQSVTINNANVTGINFESIGDISGIATVNPTTAVPGAPTNVSATADNGQATVIFTPPATGGSPIISYTVTANPGNITVTDPSSPIIVTGLNNSTAYTFTVSATNSAGTGSAATATNLYALSVSINGTGSGSVNSNPSGISSTNGTCLYNFNSGSTVNLMQIASNGSQFSGWGDVCAGSGTELQCGVPMNTLYQSVTATFNNLPNVRILGNSQLYGLIQSAYNAVNASGAIIEARGITFDEDVNLNNSMNVTLQGGSDPTFSTQSGYTTLQGTLTISQGSLVVDYLTITGGTPVSPTLVSLSISPADPNMVVATSQQFTATGTYSDDSTKDLTASVTWNSSNTSVATITGGLASTVAAGSTTITATSGSVPETTTLNVYSNLASFLFGVWTFDGSQSYWPGESTTGWTATVSFLSDNTYTFIQYDNGVLNENASGTWQLSGNSITLTTTTSNITNHIGQTLTGTITLTNNNNTLSISNFKPGEIDVYDRAASAPSAPTGLKATAGNTTIALGWTASSGATSYNVYRGTTSGGESATPIATGITGKAYTDDGLTNSQHYFYEVAAVNRIGTSPMSNEASATPSATGLYRLPPDRVTIWNPGLMSVGGIPSASWPICNATTKPLTPLGSNQDDTPQINAAIQACPVGSVVQLGAGTFLIDPGDKGNDFVFVNKGVVLRGAGAGQTILNNPKNIPTTSTNNVDGNAADPYPLIIVGPGEWVNPDGDARCQGLTAYQTQYMQLLSANGVKGSTSVTVTDGSIFKAGQFVLLDETSGASWQPDVAKYGTSIWASSDYAVSWFVHNPSYAGDDPVETGVTPSTANNFAGSGTGSDAACWFSRQDRPQNEMKQIASVSGNTVTFTSPLTMNYVTTQYAELTTYTGGNLPVTYAGVENMTLVGGGDGAVEFTNTAYSWAKNIEVMNWYGGGVSILNSFRDELRDSYIHDASWAEPGGAGYAINLQSGASEILIENNISMKANKVMVARSSGAGSVVGYNYMDDGYIATDEGWIEIGLNASHMVGSHHVLFEGNQSFNIDSDDTHGNSTYMTYFRNYATTVRSTFQSDYTGDTIDDATSPDNGPKRAAGAMGYSYWMNYVGNVLGESGVTTAANGYVDDETQPGVWNAEIWLLGWNDGPPYTVDTKVASTAIRDGNWDWFTGEQTWLTNPADSTLTLPNSLYMTSVPAFFGANTWPWVDPTTGTTYTLPAKARFDAGTPNTVPNAATPVTAGGPSLTTSK